MPLVILVAVAGTPLGTSTAYHVFRPGGRRSMCPINGCRPEGSIDLDEAFDALSHPMRRRILVALARESPRWNDEFEADEFRPQEMERELAKIRLHHYHYPKLDGSGLINWEREVGRLSLGDKFEEIRPLLELLENNQEDLPDGWP